MLLTCLLVVSFGVLHHGNIGNATYATRVLDRLWPLHPVFLVGCMSAHIQQAVCLGSPIRCITLYLWFVGYLPQVQIQCTLEHICGASSHVSQVLRQDVEKSLSPYR